MYKRNGVRDPVRVGSDLEALVQGRPAPLVRCEPISRHGAARETRETFRLDFADGTTLKGRRLRSSGAAVRVEAVARRLDPARFTRIVARHGAALLEEWIPGETLDRKSVLPAHLRWAGETLAAVHATRPRVPRPRPWLRARRELLLRHLQRLVEGGALRGEEAERLRDVAFADAPEDAEYALVHRDLCPENIVLGRDGVLRCVDNVTARGGAPEEDLARTCYRWPFDDASERTFLDAYRAHRDPGGFLRHRRFWMIAALSHASWIRHSRAYARADVPLRRLRCELAGDEGTPQAPCCALPTARS
jgi:thiamine kinase-like enzyme